MAIQTLRAPARYPLTHLEGAHAARLWLERRRPAVSIGDWRDSRFMAHAVSLGMIDYWPRRNAFNKAFSDTLAADIAGACFE